MGKASSSKKVARAARAGGRSSSGPKRQLGYPLAIGAIVLVGVLVVLFARSENQEAAAQTPTVNDHWHAAFGVYVCDTWLPPLNDVVTDTTGLHTHGDGIAHIHPFNTGASGSNATLAKWGETTGLTFTSDSFTVNGVEYANGFDCGGTPANVTLSVWSADDPDADPTVYTSDFGSVHFDSDRMAMTLAVVPEGTEVPLPETLDDLDRLDPTTDSVVPDDTTPVTALDGTSDTTVADTSTTTSTPEAAQ
jgi:hypothetical protein